MGGSNSRSSQEAIRKKPPKERHLNIKGPSVDKVLARSKKLLPREDLNFENLAFSGGGIKGYTYIGCLQVSYVSSNIYIYIYIYIYTHVYISVSVSVCVCVCLCVSVCVCVCLFVFSCVFLYIIDHIIDNDVIHNLCI